MCKLSYRPSINYADSYIADLIRKPDLPEPTTIVMEELHARPALRQPQQRTADRIINLARTSNMEALLGQMVGAEGGGCTHCTRARPAGPWDLFVTVDGVSGGSCVNCHYNNEGSRCSVRKSTAYLQPLKTCN